MRHIALFCWITFSALIVTPCQAQRRQIETDMLDDPDRLVREAATLIDSGKIEEGLLILEDAITLKPSHLAANRFLQDVYRHRGALMELEDRYQALSEQYPDDALALYLKGRLDLHLGDYAAATEIFREAIQEDLLLYSLGNVDEATIQALRRAHSESDSDALFLIMRWHHELQVQDRAAALERIHQEIEAHQDLFYSSPENLGLLVEFLAWQGRDPGKTEVARLAFVDRFPGHPDAPLYLLNLAMEAYDDSTAQYSYYTKFFDEYPHSPYRRIGYGRFFGDLIRQGKGDRVIFIASKLLQEPGANEVDLDDARQLKTWNVNEPTTLAGEGYTAWCGAALEAERYDEAAHVAGMMLESELQDPFAFYVVGRQFRRLETELDLSIRLYERSVKLARDENPAFLFYFIQGSESLDPVQADLTRIETWYELVMARQMAGRTGSATAGADSLVNLIARVPSNRLRWEYFTTAAEAFEAVNRYSDAVAQYTRALEIKFGDAEIESALHRAYAAAFPGSDWEQELDDQLHPAAADFELESLAGDTVSLEDLRGKVVVVNFWATWCGGCVKKLPHLTTFHERFHDRGLEVVAITLDEKRELVPPLVEELHLPYTILYGNRSIANHYNIGSIPVTFLVDERGRIRGKQLGYWSSIEDWIENWSRLIESLLEH